MGDEPARWVARECQLAGGGRGAGARCATMEAPSPSLKQHAADRRPVTIMARDGAA